jgi:FkbH-like protein
MSPDEAALRVVELANTKIDFLQTIRLDRALQTLGSTIEPFLNRAPKLRLAVIGSSTLCHLLPSIHVGALRRGFCVETFEGHFGMYRQELADTGSDLYRFNPDVVLIALDAHHVANGRYPNADESIASMQSLWRMARGKLNATVIQQTILPIFPLLLGNNESHHASSPATVVAEINSRLRPAAQEAGVHLLALDQLAVTHGIRALYDATLWYKSKQEVHPTAAPLWGDHVARILAALRGLSYKCLVLDLDNTVWGGIVGDDGLEGLLLGQGNAVGEAHVAFQEFALRLANRGIILGVCSKNEDANARAVFERHPEMILSLKDISCFVANWQDKATNLRHIARTLNIGLDALVFADDNPFERELIRQELPQVAVPELPDDPAYYAQVIADAGYFEALSLTREDLERTQQYNANAERERLCETVTDMASYLRGLQMQLTWSPFDGLGLGRVAQLVNKSNQFNLTTRRYTRDEIEAMMDKPDILTFQLRLFDRFGDNGMISVVILHFRPGGTSEIDTWLMSCRVLGRQVEEATLNVVTECAKSMGASRLRGIYRPTEKNGMVKEHYARLGFDLIESNEDGSSNWSLELANYEPKPTFIETVGATVDSAADLHRAY